jgi:2-amino-4-hydroxy-6-hydroxymethyldihydropteridine diphosphokinase
MARVYVSVGSNIERERHIRSGVAALRECFGPLTLSRVYESEAVGFSGDNFFNLVLGFDSRQGVQPVAAALRDIERAHARDRRAPRFSSRTLDLDLLLYGDLVLEQDGIRLPREEIIRYAFVLGPLAEIAGEMPHPVSGCSFSELWRRFPKDLQPLWPAAVDLG